MAILALFVSALHEKRGFYEPLIIALLGEESRDMKVVNVLSSKIWMRFNQNVLDNVQLIL